jgi:hypothetical protein
MYIGGVYIKAHLRKSVTLFLFFKLGIRSKDRLIREIHPIIHLRTRYIKLLIYLKSKHFFIFWTGSSIMYKLAHRN